jgi:c-di-GMP-binding flagellar brake protein YcgR
MADVEVDLEDEGQGGPDDRPLLRQRVHVRLAKWGTSLPSLVEDLLDVDLVVAAPLDLADDQGAEVGERLTIAWEAPNGPRQLPCDLLHVLTRELPHWQVRPAGPVRTEQRRRHVRVLSTDPVTIVRDRQALPGDLVDLSEGGMRCTLHDAETVIGVGDSVSAIWRIEGREHDLRARVVRVVVTPDTPRTVSLAFLDLTQTQEDELRRHVYTEQTRARARTIT